MRHYAMRYIVRFCLGSLMNTPSWDCLQMKRRFSIFLHTTWKNREARGNRGKHES